MFTFFYVLKNIFLPPTLLLGLFVGVYLLLLRQRREVRWSRRLLLFTLILYYLLSIQPTADLISAPLETKYKPIVSVEKVKGIKAIVVLGGGVELKGRFRPSNQVSASTAFRLLEAVRLYGLADSPYLVVSSGKANPFLGDYAESEVMTQFLSLIGVPGELVIQENHSRNTYENGKYTVALLNERGLDNNFVLVTSSLHMPRAMAVFLKLGMNPIPAPTDFKSDPGNYTILSFFPSTGSLGRFTSALYEYLAIIWYRMNGFV